MRALVVVSSGLEFTCLELFEEKDCLVAYVKVFKNLILQVHLKLVCLQLKQRVKTLVFDKSGDVRF